jgi:hypothetical protein
MDRVIIGNKLIHERICPNLLGFNYIIEAVNLYKPKTLMQDIYQAIADKRGIHPRRIEKAIRHAKEKSPKYGMLGNAEFIALLQYEAEQEAES